MQWRVGQRIDACGRSLEEEERSEAMRCRWPERASGAAPTTMGLCGVHECCVTQRFGWPQQHSTGVQA